MTERLSLQQEIATPEQALARITELVTETSGNSPHAENLIGLFRDKLNFLQGKLASYVFEKSDWNPVIGLTRLSRVWNHKGEDSHCLRSFLASAGLSDIEEYSEEPGCIDPHLPGMRFDSFDLDKISPIRMKDHFYKFVYRIYKVVDPSEIEELPKDKHYDTGPVGTIYHEVGVVRLAEAQTSIAENVK